MIKLLRFLFVIPTAAILFYSCAPSYIPNVVNTPMFSNKGEFQASVNTGNAGFDPQLAYAITDNVGIMLNGSFANRQSDTTENFHKHNFVELGAGYYKKIGGYGRFETYAGAGYGNVKTWREIESLTFTADAEQLRFFVQPAIGATTKFVDFSFATRFALVNMKTKLDNSTNLFIEPVGTVRLGFKYIKFSTQVGFSLPALSAGFDNEPFIFSMGLHYNFGKHWED